MKFEIELKQLKDKIINQALLIFSIIGFFTLIFTSLRAYNYGLNIAFYLQSIFILLLFIITFYRKKINLKKKIITIIILLYGIMALGLYSLGILASSKIYIAMGPIFFSFIVRVQKAIFILALYLSLYITIAMFYSLGILEYNVDPTSYANNMLSWLIDSSVILITAWGLLYVGYKFSSNLVKSNNKIKQQNIKLADNEEKYRTLFEEAPDGITLHLVDGRFFDCNKTACEMFNVSKSEFINKDPAYFSPEYQPDGIKSSHKALKFLKLALNNQPQKFEWHSIDKNKNHFNLSISLTKIKLSGITYIQAILRDITEKKRIDKELNEYKNKLEELVKKRTIELSKTNNELKNTLISLKETQQQLIQSEKMISLGTLTSGVAHEINNPLNYIMGAYIGLNNYFEEFNSKDLKNTNLYLDSIKIGIEKVSDIVKGLNDFNNDENNYDEQCLIHSIIDNCITMINNKLYKKKIKILKQYHPQEIVLKGNVSQLHQVIINILTNAIQAIEEKGIIKIITKSCSNKLVLSFVDNGCGISKENLNQIINPFFTTKAPGIGTGLGLSISYSIIKEHNGILKFDSELKKGTNVIIEIPIK